MLFSSSLRSSAGGALRSTGRRSLHSTRVPQADVAGSARQAAEGASKQLSGLAERAKAIGQPLAERASSATGVNFNSLAEKLSYNLRVAGSLLKQVYVAEGLAPPRVSAVQDAYKQLYARATDASYYQGLLKSGDWKKVAVYAVEAYGIFHIGQMIGRRHIVGYKIQKQPRPDGEHH